MSVWLYLKSPPTVSSHTSQLRATQRPILNRLMLVVPMSTLGPLSTGKGCLADRANIDVVGTYASFTVFDTGSCFDLTVEIRVEY